MNIITKKLKQAVCWGILGIGMPFFVQGMESGGWDVGDRSWMRNVDEMTEEEKEQLAIELSMQVLIPHQNEKPDEGGVYWHEMFRRNTTHVEQPFAEDPIVKIKNEKPGTDEETVLDLGLERGEYFLNNLNQFFTLDNLWTEAADSWLHNLNYPGLESLIAYLQNAKANDDSRFGNIDYDKLIKPIILLKYHAQFIANVKRYTEYTDHTLRQLSFNQCGYQFIIELYNKLGVDGLKIALQSLVNKYGAIIALDDSLCSILRAITQGEFQDFSFIQDFSFLNDVPGFGVYDASAQVHSERVNEESEAAFEADIALAIEASLKTGEYTEPEYLEIREINLDNTTPLTADATPLIEEKKNEEPESEDQFPLYRLHLPEGLDVLVALDEARRKKEADERTKRKEQRKEEEEERRRKQPKKFKEEQQ